MDDDRTTEEIIEQALKAALRDDEVTVLLAEEGLEIDGVQTLEEGGFMTLDRGVHITCPDGSEWTISINCYRRPRS